MKLNSISYVPKIGGVLDGIYMGSGWDLGAIWVRFKCDLNGIRLICCDYHQTKNCGAHATKIAHIFVIIDHIIQSRFPENKTSIPITIRHFFGQNDPKK